MAVTSAEVTRLVGVYVRMTFEADPSYGRTLRWGTLREVRGDVAIVDGFHDCSGCFGSYPDHKRTGEEVRVSDILAISAA